MSEPGAIPTYAAVAGGATVWAMSLQTWLGVIVAVLTIAALVVRLWVDVPRAWKKWKERG